MVIVIVLLFAFFIAVWLKVKNAPVIDYGEVRRLATARAKQLGASRATAVRKLTPVEPRRNAEKLAELEQALNRGERLGDYMDFLESNNTSINDFV